MDRIENLRFIVRTLLEEQSGKAGAQIPDSLPQLQAMMRSLLNVRPPLPIGEDFLTAQDAELQWQLRDKGIVTLQSTEQCGKDKRLRLWQGDITRLEVDAIVNAANSALIGCFVPMHRCIDNAIHSAAGVQLRLECERIMKEQGEPEPTGRAKLTDGYNLPARHVIHTVGPIVRGVKATPRQEMELADCYASCLRAADMNGLRSIAFCCISTGEFGFPPQRAAEIAVSTVLQHLDSMAGTDIDCVIFNVFKDSDYAIYSGLLR
ncbi:MAG: protein-ADP-ribose hydrolase [Marinilabiliaceae bacterium]